MKKIYRKIAVVALAFSVLAVSCKKDYLETDPTDSVNEDIVFEDTPGALAALNGTIRSMYAYMPEDGGHHHFGQKTYDLFSDLMGEDLVLHARGSGWFAADYTYSEQSDARPGRNPDLTWLYYYKVINNANRILQRLPEIPGEQEDKDYLRGQALTLRAHSYFYLVNFFSQYGDQNPGVPLNIEPTTEGKGRGTVKEIYDQIYADLTEAETLLDDYRDHLSHVNQSVVQGLYARVALQHGDDAKALEMASKAIQTSGKDLYSRAQYTAAAFNTLSAAEWMWGGEVNVEQSTTYPSFFSHMDNRSSAGGYAALGQRKKITKALYDQIPEGDVRKNLFQSTPDPNMPIYAQQKFQLRTPGNWASDYLFMRLSEMYLIKAEAEARQGQSGAAIQTLEGLVKERYADYSASGLAGESLLNEILLQRKIELWGEGFGILDVRRLGNGLKRPTGAGNHGGRNLNGDGEDGQDSNNFEPNVTTLPALSNRWLFAIPQDEINANRELSVADQNPSTD